MATLKFNDAAGNAMLTALKSHIESLTSPVLQIRDSNQKVLASFAIPKPCGTVENSALIFAQLTDVKGLAAGNADNFRIQSSSNAGVFAGDVTKTGGNGVLTLSKVEIAKDEDVKITKFVIGVPN